MGEATVYHIMHTEKCVAQVSTAGECKIYLEDFVPYDLVLKESNDFDTSAPMSSAFWASPPRRCRRISTFYTLPETTAVHRGWKV